MSTSQVEPSKPKTAIDQLLQFRLADWVLDFFEKSPKDGQPPRFPSEKEFNEQFKDLFPDASYEQTLITIQNIADKYEIINIGQNILVLKQIFTTLIQANLKEFELTNQSVIPIIHKLQNPDSPTQTRTLSSAGVIEEVDNAIKQIRQNNQTPPTPIELPKTIKITNPIPTTQTPQSVNPTAPLPIQQPITLPQTTTRIITLPNNSSKSPSKQSGEPANPKPSSSSTRSTTKKLEDTVTLTHTELTNAITQLIQSPAISATLFKAKIDAANQQRIAGKIANNVATQIIYSTHTADYQELSPVLASEIYEHSLKEPETTDGAKKLTKSDDFLVAVDQVSETNHPAVTQANTASQILLISTLADPQSSPSTHSQIIDKAIDTGLKINPETATAKNKQIISEAIHQIYLPNIANQIIQNTQEDFDKNIPLNPQSLLQNLRSAEENSYQNYLKHLDSKLDDKTLLTLAAPRFVTDVVSHEILQPVNIYSQGQYQAESSEITAAENHAFASLMDNPKRQQQSYEEFLSASLNPNPERRSFLSRSIREINEQESISVGQSILLKNYSDELELYEQIPEFNAPKKHSVWRMGNFSRSYYSQSPAGQTITRSANFIPKKSFFSFSQKFSAGRAKGKLKGFAKKGALKVGAKLGISAAVGAGTGGISLLVQAGLMLAAKYKKQIAYILATLAFLAYMFLLWILANIVAFAVGFAVGAAIGFALGGPVGALIGGFLGGTASVWLYNHFPGYATVVNNLMFYLPKIWGAVSGWATGAASAIWSAGAAAASFTWSAAGAVGGFISGIPGASAIGGLVSSGTNALVGVATNPAVLIPTATVGSITTFSILSYSTVSSALFTNPSLPEQIVLPGDATEGETSNTYIQIQKLASVNAKSLGPAKTIKLENSDLPQTVTYTVNISAQNQPIYDIVCTDTITHVTKSGNIRNLTSPTINCPTTLNPNQTASISYDLPIPNETIFQDSSISNKFSISFKSFDPNIIPIPAPGGGFTNSVSSSANDLSSVFIGTPAGDCPSGWPAAGSGNVTQGPGGLVSHSSLEAIDVATFYTDSLLATFNGVVEYKYTDPAGNHPITGRTGLTVILSGTCNGTSFRAIYGHMDSFGPGIEVGAVITKGQIVGYEGFTGYILPPDVRGTHLHYEFRGLRMEPPYIPVDVRGCSGSCAAVN